jgi:hypothetical protein
VYFCVTEKSHLIQELKYFLPLKEEKIFNSEAREFWRIPEN